MSNAWLEAAMKNTTATNGARLMLFVLADRADDSGVSYYGMDKLISRTALSHGSAHAAINQLKKLGIVRVQYKAGKNGTNIYTLQNLDCPDIGPSRIQTVQILSPTLQNLDENPPESGPNPSGSIRDPSIDKERGACASLSQKPLGIESSEVEEIYRLYPRKKKPVDARKAIGKTLTVLTKRGIPEPVAWLKNRVGQYAKSREGQEEQFTPYPATWFNAGSYDEDFTTPAPAARPPDRNGKPAGIDMSKKIDRF